MTVQDYLDTVASRLEDEGYSEVEELPDELDLETVYAQRVKSVRFGGMAYKFISLVDGDITRATAKKKSEALRTLMTDESLNVLGIGENMVGYVVLPQHGLDEDVEVLITDEYDNQKGTAFVFPIGVDLDSETLITHPVPRLKGRTAYTAQKKDAEKYFTP